MKDWKSNFKALLVANTKPLVNITNLGGKKNILKSLKILRTQYIWTIEILKLKLKF